MQPNVPDLVRQFRSWANTGVQEAIIDYTARTGQDLDGMIHEQSLLVKHINVVLCREAPTKSFRVKRVIVATGQKDEGTYLDVTAYFIFGESADDAIFPVTLEYPIDGYTVIH